MSETQEDRPWDSAAWAEWAVGLYEPGIDPYDRIATLESMRAQARTHKDRAVTILGGALADIVDSLPDGDTWRRSVTAKQFGTWQDGADLMPRQVGNIREDIGLAALARPLEKEAVQLLRAATKGWKATVKAAEQLEEPVEPLTRALTWATWRRRAYQGQDEWPVLAVFMWINLAKGLEAGVSPDDDFQRAEQKRAAKLPDDLI